MQPGDTFVVPDAYGTHLNAVIEVLEDGSVIHVHFTTFYGRGDTTCTVEPGEHPFFRNKSIVRYDKAVVCEKGDALDALNRSIHKKLDPLSPELLKKVRQGALDSPQTSPKIKKLLTEKRKPK